MHEVKDNKNKYITIITIVLVAAVLIYAGVTTLLDSLLMLDDLCEVNPEYPLCVEADATNNEIVTYIMEDIIAKAEDDNTEYCEQYFYARMRPSCREEMVELLPDNYASYSTLEVVSLNDKGLYQISLYDDTGDHIGSIDIILDKQYGILKFSHFLTHEYVDELEDRDIEIIQVHMYQILTAFLRETPDGHCKTMYTGEALVGCVLDTEDIYIPTYGLNTPDEGKLVTGTTYRFHMGDNDEGYEVYYVASFTYRDGELVVYKLDVEYQLH